MRVGGVGMRGMRIEDGTGMAWHHTRYPTQERPSTLPTREYLPHEVDFDEAGAVVGEFEDARLCER